MSTENGRQRISVSEVLEYLANGVTRCVGDPGYNEERGSIQEKYNLTKAQVGRMFTDPTLKGKKVRFPKEDPFVLVDDIDGSEETSPVQYGERSQASVGRAEEASETAPAEEREMPEFGEIKD